MNLPVRKIDPRLFSLLGIDNKGSGWQGNLVDFVVPVVPLPLDERYCSPFIGFGDQAAVAAQASSVQLWNPADSGVYCYVKRILPALATGGAALALHRHNAALATLLGTGFAKYLGGSVSAAQLRSAAAAAIPGTQIGQVRIATAFLSYELRYDDDDDSIIIPPGLGLHVTNTGVNSALYTGWEWEEKSVS